MGFIHPSISHLILSVLTEVNKNFYVAGFFKTVRLELDHFPVEGCKMSRSVVEDQAGFEEKGSGTSATSSRQILFCKQSMPRQDEYRFMFICRRA